MNIKLRLDEVRLLIDKRYPIDQIQTRLQPIAKQANLIFADLQVGAGYLQWSLPGNGWTPFSKGDDSQKAAVASAYKTRKEQMQNSLRESPFKEVVFSVPSEDFIFFRKNDIFLEIALTAWAYKYPDKLNGGELDTWISKQNLQKVNIAFSWADKTLPEMKFKLAGHLNTTSPDGFKHVDGPLPVGNTYNVETLIGHHFILTVEQGKENYVFDLTQYCQVKIQAYQDGTPISECSCGVNFNGDIKTITTDNAGRALVQLPLICNPLGELITPQPPCIVNCRNEQQQQTPINNGDLLNFNFNFKTETPQPPKNICRNIPVKVEVFKDNKPVEGQSVEIRFEENPYISNTDNNGNVLYEILKHLDEQGCGSEQYAVCEVICGEQRQKRSVQKDTTELLFHFDLPVEEKTYEKPEYVYIQLNDYAGVPMPNLQFNLTTKKKGRTELKTDQDGKCKVPKEWFSSKEKMKIDIFVSTEYQKTHDIHLLKDKKKK